MADPASAVQRSSPARDAQVAEVERLVAEAGPDLAQRLDALAAGGSAYAAWQLGVFVDTGEYDIDVDVDRAFRLFTAAAAAGEPLAHASLGLMHALGRGTPVDYGASRLAYAEAAAASVAHGYFGIGVLYALGQGVERDESVALAHFIVAAAMGDRQALDPIRQIMQIVPKTALPKVVERSNAMLSAAGRAERVRQDGDRVMFGRLDRLDEQRRQQQPTANPTD